MSLGSHYGGTKQCPGTSTLQILTSKLRTQGKALSVTLRAFPVGFWQEKVRYRGRSLSGTVENPKRPNLKVLRRSAQYAHDVTTVNGFGPIGAITLDAALHIVQNGRGVPSTQI